jgi:cytoskeletal protein CcmA (bactofilin family)
MSDQPGSGSTSPERRVTGWIGKAVRVEGKVISTEDLTIDGQVEGSIELGDNSLTIGLGAGVKAELRAKVIVINGAVIGNIRATEKVELRATGSVEGNISTPQLLLAGGATVNGKVETGSKYKPK